ncbi:hypothetical protein [Dyadobacter aurulentus]|uniref:hypothetical protein n=1 Tax=Dyadobacter sp. UC 10 TaxID=2605428 RepID=UPI0011F2628E|nr:hypothetical protein [Dyadobacter sp. UC 10]KAA0992769.1 hypothetical protein FXO21_22620 [Dyadobacter sp. UC 10]
MAQDVKIIANIGYVKGYSGNGMLFVGKTEGGTYMALMKHLENNVEVWKYYRKSRIESGIGGGDIILQSDFNFALLTDIASPEFVADGENVFPTVETVTNGDEAPRLFNFEPAYTVKGEGVSTSDIDKLKTTTPNTPGSANTGGTTTNPPAGNTGGLNGLFPADFGLILTNPVKFFQDNIMFVILVLAAIWFFRRKKKKPLFIF